MLKVENLHVKYGAIHAVKGIDLEVKEGEIVTLIGANGAGKSSILKAISGLEKAAEGSITFNGQPLNKLSARNIMKLGISHVPEGRRIFAGLTVLENLEMGRLSAQGQGRYQRRSEKGVFPLSDLGKTQQAGCGYAVRRRTADVGDGTRFNGKAKAFVIR